MTPHPSPPIDTRCGFVALIGAPNAGKSTLINRLVGTRISPVNRKVQTTRRIIRGIVMQGAQQIVLVDTPGLFQAQKKLERAMVHTAWGGVADSDVICVLVDAKTGLKDNTRHILSRMKDILPTSQLVFLVLNKVDCVEKPQLLKLTQELHELFGFSDTFMLSAKTGQGCFDLIEALGKNMPVSPWHYDPDDVTDLPMRDLAAEITREKILDRVHAEIPYQLTVVPHSWEAKSDGSVRIEQRIVLREKRHREIILGKGGETIKSISMASRKSIEQALDMKVHLFLTVDVDKNWMDKSLYYTASGLDQPSL